MGFSDLCYPLSYKLCIVDSYCSFRISSSLAYLPEYIFLLCATRVKANFHIICLESLLKELIKERVRRDLDKNSFESQSKTLFRLLVCYLITLNLKGIHPAGSSRRRAVESLWGIMDLLNRMLLTIFS